MQNQSHIEIEERKNKLLEKFEELKMVLEGRDYKFLPYTTNEEGEYDENLTLKLVKLLMENIVEGTNEEKEMYYYNFFSSAITFCLASCPEEDMTFQSIVKLATTVERENGVSTYDILVKNSNERYEEDCNFYKVNGYYEEFYKLYPQYYEEKSFANNIKNAINKFLEKEEISFFSNDEQYGDAEYAIEKSIQQLKYVRKNNLRGRGV